MRRLFLPRATVTVVFVFVAVTADSVSAGSRPNPCGKHKTCAPCASDGACRWTIEIGCRPRSKHPDDSILSQGNFIEDPAKCGEVFGAPLRCWMLRSCGTCLADPACGWCMVMRSLIQRRCQAANDDEACPPDKFTRDVGACEPDPTGKPLVCAPPTSCAAYNICASCALDPACGWCNATLTCHAAGDRAACSGSFATTRFACPPLNAPPTRPHGCQDPCAKHGDCATCASDPNCGFCPGENRCRWGTTNVSTCSTGWAKSPRACPRPKPDSCTRLATCAECLGVADCNWCPGSNRCEYQGAACGGEIYYSAAQCAGAKPVQPVPETRVIKRPPRAAKISRAIVAIRNMTTWSLEVVVATKKTAAGATFSPLPVAERVTTTVEAGQWLVVRRADAPKALWRQSFPKRLQRTYAFDVVPKPRGRIGGKRAVR